MTGKRASVSRSSAASAIRLVVAREVAARVPNRSFVISTLVSVAMIIGLLFVFGSSWAERRFTVVVTGAPVADVAPGSGEPGGIRWRGAENEPAAREQVAGRDADAALVIRGADVRMLVRNDTTPQVRDSATAAVRQWATVRALRLQHVDIPLLERQVAVATPRMEPVGGPVRGGAELGAAVGIVTVLFFQLFGYGVMVAQGVVEEKSTRVVEVLLSTLTPLRLMVGKVLGIGITAVLQTAVFGVALVGSVQFADVLPAEFPATSAVAAAVGWFVLGFLFFAFLFAAAGSLVSRAEEVSTTVMPVLTAMMVVFGVAVATLQDLNGTWVQVIRYVPPFSMLLMPLEVSVQAAGWRANLVAALLMVAATAGLAVVTGRVYQRSILRLGAPVRWREVFGHSG